MDSPAPRTTITRLAGKSVTERERLDALLDGCLVGHIGLISDGHPVVIPTAVARMGDQLLAHGSTGSRWMRALAAGADASVAVTELDAVVVARSTFESSLHYRSAVLFGRFAVLDGAPKLAALDAMVERLIPGRLSETRASDKREVAATMVLSMPIERWSLKVSDGWPLDEPADVRGDAWAGVVPIRRSYGTPVPAPDLRVEIPVPPSVRGFAGR